MLNASMINKGRRFLVADVNDAGWGKSMKYQKLTEPEKKLLMGFINSSVLTAYRQ